jgi:hypothetical protein
MIARLRTLDSARVICTCGVPRSARLYRTNFALGIEARRLGLLADGALAETAQRLTASRTLRGCLRPLEIIG